jgi:hypothetical protein
VRVVEELHGWRPPAEDLVARMKTATAELAELGIHALD